MNTLHRKQSHDWQQVGFDAARVTNDLEKAKAICGHDLCAFRETFQAQTNALNRHIPAREAQRNALCSQLYGSIDPVSDKQMHAHGIRLKALGCLLTAVAFTSIAAHTYRLLLFGIMALTALALGTFLTMAVAAAGHLAFEKLIHNSKLAHALVIGLASCLLFWGVYQLSQAGAIAITKTETTTSSASYVEDPENTAPAPQAPRQSGEKQAEELLSAAVTKIFLGADLMLGLLLAIVVRMHADEKYATWKKIEKCDAELAHMKKTLDHIESEIEIAHRKCMAGILRFFYTERRQHPTYFGRTVVCVAVIFLGLTAASVSAQNIRRQEGILIDRSGSIGHGDVNKQLFREYLKSTRQLLLTEPPNSRVLVIPIATDSFGATGELLSGWTPGTHGIFTDDLERARRELVSKFESNSAGMTPIAAATDIIGGLWRIKDVLEESPSDATVGEREIWIFSDMVNETTSLPMPELLAFGADKLLDRAKANRLIVPLQGYKVHVIGATTAGRSPQTWSTVKAFWVKYFRACDATLASYSPHAEVRR